MSRNIKEVAEAWKRVTENARDCFKETGQYDRLNSYVFENHSQDTLGGGSETLVAAKTCDVRFTSENTKNVRSNVYETDISRTIDTGGNAPDSNQGGIAVVQQTQFESKSVVAMTTGEYMNPIIDKSPTLLARDYKDPTIICYKEHCDYTVRKLTPLECARLQGFPDWWTDNLEMAEEEITEDVLSFWREVFETHRKIVTGVKKPKTDKQIKKWLMNPYTDTALYKMWGNGVALPCVLYVIEGIKEELSKEREVANE